MAHNVLMSKEDGVAYVTILRPEARNALLPEMIDQLADALEECKPEDVRAVVITGSGNSFCSGADVKDLAQALAVGPEHLSSHLKGLAGQLHRNVVLKIRRLPKPVIASINGVAAGAGFSLALACDLRIASVDARFFLAYSNIGATADGGSSYYLPRLLGPGRAMEVYLMDRPMTAHRALEMGIVGEVVEANELENHTKDIALRLASGPTVAYGRVKSLMDRALYSDLESQLEEEAQAIGDIAATGDFQEGITAFVEKRAPRFQGK